MDRPRVKSWMLPALLMLVSVPAGCAYHNWAGPPGGSCPTYGGPVGPVPGSGIPPGSGAVPYQPSPYQPSPYGPGPGAPQPAPGSGFF